MNFRRRWPGRHALPGVICTENDSDGFCLITPRQAPAGSPFGVGARFIYLFWEGFEVFNYLGCVGGGWGGTQKLNQEFVKLEKLTIKNFF